MNLSPYRCVGFAILLAALALPSAAAAQEVFGGLYRHDATIFRAGGRIERGEDFQLGYRFGPIFSGLSGLRPHVMILANTNGGADFASAGVSWKFGGQFYLRPGVGLAVHDGDVHLTPAYLQRHRIPFGSPVLFAPELSAGIRVARNASLEATWLHFSHASLFSHVNPGIDDVGLRLNVAF
jgi:hypothetical protein